MKYNLINEQNSVAVGNVGTAYLYATLEDQIYNPFRRKIPVNVVADGEGTLDINVKGYRNSIITLEICDGQLRLLVWADRKSEEPTHIINLEGAKEKVKKVKKHLTSIKK